MHVVLIAHNIMHLSHLHQVYLAKRLLARLTTQAKTALVAEDDLKVVEAPRDKLPRQALVIAFADLAQECIV